jgi:CBS domain-containing protein
MSAISALTASADPRIRDFDPGRVLSPAAPNGVHPRLPGRSFRHAQRLLTIPDGRLSDGPTVAGLMSEPTFTLSPDACVLEAAYHLIGRDRPELIVVSAHAQPLGVIGQRDLLRCWPAGGVDLSRRPIETLLLRPARLLSPDMGVAPAAAVLLEEGVDAAPVVDADGVLIGILATRHILRLVARDQLPA